VSVASSASLTLVSAGCRVLVHTVVDDLVMADDDRQRSMGFRDLLHGVRQPGSARIDDRDRWDQASRHHTVQLVDDHVLWHRTDDALGRLAVLEDQPGRDALDPIRRNRSEIFIRVTFHHFELALVLTGECLDEVCWPIDRCSLGF
jgi:hypothetical protein